MMPVPRLIDLSHIVRSGVVTVKGLPAPMICDFLSREASRTRYTDDAEFHIGRIDMVGNTGTYVDSPFHRYADGKDLSEVDLARFVDLPAVVVRVDHRERIEIGRSDFEHVDVAGRAVLVHTGWSEHWGSARYLEANPFLTKEAAIYLRDAGATLVGIDSHNLDDTRAPNSRPAHSVLLRQEIIVAEHLRGLELLPDEDFLFSAVPPKVQGFGTFPVRAFARLR
jgi:arylformamidase